MLSETIQSIVISSFKTFYSAVNLLRMSLKESFQKFVQLSWSLLNNSELSKRVQSFLKDSKGSQSYSDLCKTSHALNNYSKSFAQLFVSPWYSIYFGRM